MKKKVVIIICILLAVALLAFGCSVLSSTGYQGTVKQALRIHFGWESEEHLQDIATKAFTDRLGGDSFANGRELYFIGSIKLQSGEGYDLENGEIQVTATIYNPDIMFADFVLVKNDEGKYLIKDIQFDK